MANSTDGTGSSIIQFQTFDTIVLKTKPTYIGTVERTFYDFSTHHDPLTDLLIFSHLPVPEHILQEFLASGGPPKGYIFVDFADEELGTSLIAETDATLLSRSLATGDTVKRHAGDHMIGTVVSAFNFYVLQPICRPAASDGDFKYTFDVKPEDPYNSTCEARLPSGVSHTRPHELLYDIPERELKRASDFQEGDHVLHDDWVGQVKAIDCDVAIMLKNNSVVWVESPWELFLIIPDLEMSPVAIPDIELGEIKLPELNLQSYNGIDTMQPRQFMRGELVVTNHKNLKNGRWLRGYYDPSVDPAGRVLDVRSRRLDMHWFVPSSWPSRAAENTQPPRFLTPYENLTSFRNPRDLRPKKDIVLYDYDGVPRHVNNMPMLTPPKSSFVQNSLFEQEAGASNTTSLPEPRSMGMDVKVGERVRFIDTSLAARQYGKADNRGHGSFNKIQRETTDGFDMNEFKVITISQHVEVQWQDQSTTKHPSIELQSTVMPEQDLIPGDIVFSKEGMKQEYTQNGQVVYSDFNEMSYFEQQADLVSRKVGVVQSVNPQERIARVRWFIAPRIDLKSAGLALGLLSEFGEIGALVEDMSLYEIMTFPAVSILRGSLVILLPRGSFQSIGVSNPQECQAALNRGMSNSRPTDVNSPPFDLISSLKIAAVSRLSHLAVKHAWTVPWNPLPITSTTTANSYDWIAEIVDIGLDGSLTVRFGGMEFSQDARISRDHILLKFDPELALPEQDDEPLPFTDDEIFQYDSTGDTDPIDEEIQYEGGERMDEDSDDGGWITDEEGNLETQNESSVAKNIEPVHNICPTLSNPPEPTSIPNGTDFDDDDDDDDVDVPMEDPDELQNSAMNNIFKLAVNKLSSAHTSEPPPQFDVLSAVPETQFQASKTPNSSPSFLKRIAREHKILRSSLPPNTIYVRTYESRLDLLRCLIVGPAGTPYELAPFLIDLYLSPQFPREPPTAHFHSWTSGMGRINPNLYEEGKICLSLLGTWPGQSTTEGWSENATILQVLISLQGLVFVRQPLYNEAGYEVALKEQLYTLESQQYNEKAYVFARAFIKHALLSPIEGLQDVLAWLYSPATPQISDTARSGAQEATAESNRALDRVTFLVSKSETTASKTPTSADQSTDRDLLRRAITQVTSLMTKSESLKTTAQADKLVDGSGESADAEKVFLRPLSLGAMVQLRKTVAVLQQLLDEWSVKG